MNLLAVEKHCKTKELFNLFLSNGLFPMITKPTRITHNTASLIDNIYVSKGSMSNSFSGILVYDLSDHLPVLTFTGKSKPITKECTTITYRPMTPSNKDLIRNALSVYNWDSIMEGSADEAYGRFMEVIQNTFDQYAPLKTIKRNSKFTKQEPWMTYGLLKSSNTLQKLYKKQIQAAKDDPKHIKFVKYRNLYNKLKRIAKQNHINEKLQENKHSMQNTWKILNSVIGKQHDKLSIIHNFNINNCDTKNPRIIANSFCEYFSQVGSTYANKIPGTDVSSNAFLTNRLQDSMFLTPTTPVEILHVVNTLKNKSSSGWDNISTKLLKELKHPLMYPICVLVNKSLADGIFPTQLKLAKVVPIHKSKDRQNIENYRPISLLPSISKIFEKIVFKRLYSFLEAHSILYHRQYGFRPNHSTIDAILDFAQNIYKSLEKNEVSIGVFLDLSKAFDTIDHNILLSKLNWYGIRGRALDWFRSYLSGRKQFVHFGGTNSVEQTVTYGVPQGSILGPLLFIIYTNDLQNSLKTCNSILFADDTTIFHSSKNVKHLYKEVNADLANLHTWFKANKLSLNILKTYYILFQKNKKLINTNLDIKIDSTVIPAKETLKFLGMIVDNQLKWHNHVSYIQSKLNSSLFILNRVKHMLHSKHLVTLYYSLIYPYLSYGLVLWGDTHRKYINKILTFQKKAMRIINRKTYNEHTNELFIKQGILKLPELYHWNVATYMYKYVKRLLPSPLLNSFVKMRDYHTYNTRNLDNFLVPNYKMDCLRRSFLCEGPKTWNSLSTHLQNSNTLSYFKINYKQNLLQSYVLHAI